MSSSITVSLRMIDQMSQKLEAIATAGEKVVNSFEALGKQANEAFDKVNSGCQSVSEAMNITSNAAVQCSSNNSRAEESLKKFGDASEETSEKIQQWGEESKEAGEKAAEAGDKSAKAVVSLGEAIAAAGITMAIKEMTKAYLEFDDAADQFEASMAKVSTIADTAAMSLAEMQSDISKLSQETGQSVNDLSESVYSAMSASIDTADAVQFVANANALAVGGFTDSAKAVDVLTTAINAYGLSAEDAAAISDRLINTQNLGKLTVDELGASMGMVIPTAATLDVDLDNLSSAYVTLTRNGINVANATTMINGMFSELADGGSDVAKILEDQTGKSFAQLMSEGKNLGDVMAILGESVNGDSVAFMNLWSNVRAGRGAVNIFNAGAAEFADVMESMAGSAGAADEAFKKMTSTGQYVEQKWENAIENFKIAMGDAQPSLDGIMSKGTEILNKMTSFIEKNPKVVAGITAGAVALGSFVTVVAGTTTVLKLATIAMDAFTASAACNPVFLGITAVAALTAGLVVLSNSIEDTADYTNRLTVSSQELSDKIEAQQDEVNSLAKKYGEFDDRVISAKLDLQDMQDEFASTGQTIGDLNAKMEESIDTWARSRDALKDEMDAISETESTSLMLIEKLNRLNDVSMKSEEQRKAEETIVKKLNATYPDLGASYDMVTGKVNMSTEALKEYCKQQAESRRLESKMNDYTEALMQQETAKENLEAGQKEVNRLYQEYIDLINEANQAALNGENPDWTNELKAGEALEAYNKERKAVEELEKTYNDMTDTVIKYEASIDGLTGATKNAATATEDLDAKNKEIHETLKGVLEELDEQSQKYVETMQKIHEAAVNAVNGFSGTFEKVKIDSSTTAEDMTKAWDSQAEALSKYNENLHKAQELKFDDNLISKLADGSQESAGKLQSLMDEVDKLSEKGKSVEDFVKQMNESFGKVEEAKETLTKTLEGMNEEANRILNQIKTDMDGKMEALDLSGPAATAAEKTMKAYIDQLEIWGRTAADKAAAVSTSIENALNGATSKVKSRYAGVQENANGTTYGDNVYIAGEYGPELIVGRQGSEVFPASETAKILNAVMNLRENKADVDLAPQEITNNIIHTSNSTNTNNENRNITLTIKGKGSLDIGQSVSQKDLHTFISEELEGAIASILSREMYEEGSFAYNF